MKSSAKRNKNLEKSMEKDDDENEDWGEETESAAKKTKGGSFCEVCNKKFRSRYHVKLHMAVHTGEKNYICGICKKGYQQKWNLITHVARVHSKEKPFKCNDCGKAFGYSSHFKRHVKTHFLEKIEAPETVKKRILNPHKCEFCDKSFESNYRRDLHMRVHTGIRPYVCDKCGKSFTIRRLCSIHMKKRHNAESDFVCEHCGKTFPDRSFIVAHLKTGHKLVDLIESHTPHAETQNEKHGDKLSEQSKKEVIPCEVCGKSITRGSVKKHLNIHYRSRIYPCRHCEKEFLESGQRMVHERMHTGEKPYLCDICGRGHTQYGNLLTHRKKYHNLVEKTPKLWKRNCAGKIDVARLCLPKTFDDEMSAADDLQCLQEEIKEKAIFDKGSGSGKDKILSSKSDVPEAAKPKYTGNETIEQFLKIASTWVNKKFQESKNKSTQCDEEEDDDGVVEQPNEMEKVIGDDFPEAIDTSNDGESNDASDQQIGKSNRVEEDKKNCLVKEVKRKINKIIFEKIVENLRNTPVKDSVTQVVEKISEVLKHKEIDVLREFLKLMKSVPENVVMRAKDGKLLWHCWMCDSTLRNRHLLARHLLIHEPEENRPYKCDICQKTFTQSNNFKEHIMSHYNENQFYCDKCGSGFRHKSHFNMHMRRHNLTTASVLPKKFECIYCGKKLNTNYQKIEHERTHTREKPYLCKVCGQQFGALSTLNRHQSTHTNASHQCVVCLKKFRQKSSLKRHYGTHSEYPYSRASCECGKTFSQSTSLKKHKMICKNRVEPVVKPFGCVVCSKRFLTKSDLKRHVATHDSSRTFKCSICAMHLKTDETLKRHMRRHGEKQKETENGFKCDECLSVFPDKEILRNHFNRSHVK